MDPRDVESLEARIRLKFGRRERLTREERAFFARMPATKEIPPAAVQRGETEPPSW